MSHTYLLGEDKLNDKLNLMLIILTLKWTDKNDSIHPLNFQNSPISATLTPPPANLPRTTTEPLLTTTEMTTPDLMLSILTTPKLTLTTPNSMLITPKSMLIIPS